MPTAKQQENRLPYTLAFDYLHRLQDAVETLAHDMQAGPPPPSPELEQLTRQLNVALAAAQPDPVALTG